MIIINACGKTEIPTVQHSRARYISTKKFSYNQYYSAKSILIVQNNLIKWKREYKLSQCFYDWIFKSDNQSIFYSTTVLWSSIVRVRHYDTIYSNIIVQHKVVQHNTYRLKIIQSLLLLEINYIIFKQFSSCVDLHI